MIIELDLLEEVLAEDYQKLTSFTEFMIKMKC